MKQFLVLVLMCIGISPGCLNAKPLVAVIGAGPAGVSAAYELSKLGVEVVVFNRERTPGGGVLKEYYWRKNSRKGNSLDQYGNWLDHPGISYVGGLEIKNGQRFSRADLIRLGFNAIVYAVGAPVDNNLGIPGEEFAIPTSQVSHHYNWPWTNEFLPRPSIGRRVAASGGGQSTGDLSRFVLEEHPDVKVLYVLIRNNPVDALEKLGDRHFSILYHWLDLEDFISELSRHTTVLSERGFTPTQFSSKWLRLAKRDERPGGLIVTGEPSPKVKLRFTSRATSLRKNNDGSLEMEVDDGMGNFSRLQIDTKLSIVGFQVDPDGLDLPVRNGRFRVKKDGVGAIENYEIDVEGAIPSYAIGWAKMNGSDSQHEGDAQLFAPLLVNSLFQHESKSFSPSEIETRLRTIYSELSSIDKSIFLNFPSIGVFRENCMQHLVAKVRSKAELRIRLIELKILPLGATSLEALGEL